MKKRNLFAIGLFLFSIFAVMPSALALDALDQALFDKANKAYYSEKYAEAEKIYADLAARHPEQAAFQFNLGNSGYRLGKTGPAILAYERARLLEPRNRDTARNLAHVRAGLEYRVEDKRNWYLRAGEKLLERVTEAEVSAVTAAAYLLFMISWCLPLWLQGGLRFGPLQKTLLVLLLLAGLVYAAKRVEMRMIRDAVVMVKKAEVRFGPSEGDRIAFRLGEGLKVFVVDRREEWSRVILTSGEDGWIKNAQIAEILS